MFSWSIGACLTDSLRRFESGNGASEVQHPGNGVLAGATAGDGVKMRSRIQLLLVGRHGVAKLETSRVLAGEQRIGNDTSEGAQCTGD